MSIDLDRFLVETAQKVTTTYNEMGDKQYGSSTPVSCLYRDISVLNETTNRYEVDISGILWFAASETVSRGDVYYHASEGYLQIEGLTKAKRLIGDDTTQFKKCTVSKQRQVS